MDVKLSSALARLEPRIDLVDDVDAPLAPHDAAVLVALFQRLQRIGDLHDTGPREGAEHRYPGAPGQSLSRGRFPVRSPSDKICAAGVDCYSPFGGGRTSQPTYRPQGPNQGGCDVQKTRMELAGAAADRAGHD